MAMSPLRRAATLTTLAGAALLAACGGGDDNDFNPRGVQQDVAALTDALEAEEFQAFTTAAAAMDAQLGGPVALRSSAAVRAAAPASLADGAAAAREAMRRVLAVDLSRPGGNGMAALVIPPEALGTTFVWNPETGQYDPSDRTGAPGNGVRFILYAVNQLGEFVVPLVETGYVDVLDESTASADAVRFVAVNGATTFLNYGVQWTGTEDEGEVAVNGFLGTGSRRVNFDITATASPASNGTVVIDFALTVPSRDFTLDYTITGTNMSSGTETLALDMRLAGENGDLRLEFTTTGEVGQGTVSVNGAPFAVINVDGGATSITAPDGGELSQDELQAVGVIYAFFAVGLFWFVILVGPVAGFIPSVF